MPKNKVPDIVAMDVHKKHRWTQEHPIEFRTSTGTHYTRKVDNSWLRGGGNNFVLTLIPINLW